MPPSPSSVGFTPLIFDSLRSDAVLFRRTTVAFFGDGSEFFRIFCGYALKTVRNKIINGLTELGVLFSLAEFNDPNGIVLLIAIGLYWIQFV